MSGAWNWITQNQTWLFSGVGISVFGFVWWLVKKLGGNGNPGNDKPATPNFNINVSPNISPTISSTQTAAAPHGVDEQDQQRPQPNVGSLRPEIATVSYNGESDAWAKGSMGNAVPAALLAFSNTPCPPKKTTSVEGLRARLTYYEQNRVEEFKRLDSGCWLNEAYRSIDMHVGDIVYLIAAIRFDGHTGMVANPRYSSNRYSEDRTVVDHLPDGIYELKVDLFGGEHGEYAEAYWFQLVVGEQLQVRQIDPIGR